MAEYCCCGAQARVDFVFLLLLCQKRTLQPPLFNTGAAGAGASAVENQVASEPKE